MEKKSKKAGASSRHRWGLLMNGIQAACSGRVAIAACSLVQVDCSENDVNE
jgi:hypothetical protein